MSLLQKQTFFEHENVEYRVVSFFYRVEFQARGAPHLHCMFWMEGGNGEIPPSLHNEDKDGNINFEENARKISSFGSSVICGSSNDINCKDHNQYDSSCDGCKRLKEIVEHYQTHSHHATCLKKKKFTKITQFEGHGRLDDKKAAFELIVQTCRFNFPKNPSDETIFLPVFPQNYDKKDLKKANEDYNKIRKYLLRLTDGETFKDQEQWKNFLNFSFDEFLYEVGMFPKDKDITDKTALANARERYFTALRCEVKSSGMLLLKRDPCDIFTNNFNKNLLQIHKANQDVQLIFDEYAVAEYVSDYCTKQESGQSNLMKSINDNAVATGEKTKETIRKLAKALDKGRECGIQEAIYRVLGLPLTKFSSIVKFINTNHPDHREGLLKADYKNLEEGESIFHNSIHDYYQDRPRNSEEDSVDWDSMTLAEFVADYNVHKAKPASKNVISLQNKRGYLIKRNTECVIRYFLKYEHETEYYRALCILFLPFRNERKEIHMKDVHLLYKENEESIEQIRSYFEQHRKIVDIIKEREEKQDNVDDDNEDDDDEFIEHETTTTEELEEFEKYFQNQAKQQLYKYMEGKEEMSEDDYLSKVESLNKGCLPKICLYGGKLSQPLLTSKRKVS